MPGLYSDATMPDLVEVYRVVFPVASSARSLAPAVRRDCTRARILSPLLAFRDRIRTRVLISRQHRAAKIAVAVMVSFWSEHRHRQCSIFDCRLLPRWVHRCLGRESLTFQSTRATDRVSLGSSISSGSTVRNCFMFICLLSNRARALTHRMA